MASHKSELSELKSTMRMIIEGPVIGTSVDIPTVSSKKLNSLGGQEVYVEKRGW